MYRKLNLILFCLVIILAVFTRTYRMQELSIFIADQAIISTEVLKIIRGDLTLLGTRTSIAPIYFGPIALYLMVPFYYLFNGYPLAGTIFQTILQILTIPIIFLIGKKVKNSQVGIFATFIFSISGLLIEYSRAAFNTTTALSLSTLAIYLLFLTFDRYSSWKIIVMGILLGWVFQINFITVSLFIAIATFPILFYRKLMTFKYYSLLAIGFLIGFSPYLLFELRHNFLNSLEMFNYLFRSESGNSKSIMFIFTDVPLTLSKLLYGIENFWLGLLSVLFMIHGTILILKKKSGNIFFNFLLYLVANAILISILYGRHLESIYLIAIQTTLIIIFAFVSLFVFKKNYLMILFMLSLLLFLNIPSWNLHKKMHYLQDGLFMTDFEKAASIIWNDNSRSIINVSMDAQRDNRAMPLRYFLFLKNIPFLSYEDYENANELYFIVRKNKDLKDIKIWEFKAFGSSKVIEKWNINDQYIMYKLSKSSNYLR